MACFIVPGTEAIVATAAAITFSKIEAKKAAKLSLEGHESTASGAKIAFSKKLSWLASLLWGGVILLAFEHLWHGEISPFFPFLTAASEGPDAISEMLAEMASTGVLMAVLCTAVWGAACLVADAILKRQNAVSTPLTQG